MSLTSLPQLVSKSRLVRELVKAASETGGTDFDYVGELHRLAIRVTREVTYISRIFPEYTPHDAELHLSRLFVISDQILTAERYKVLTAAELFLLAAALYAHDWGMAVSESEKSAIEGDKGPFEPDLFYLLPEEQSYYSDSRETDTDIHHPKTWNDAQWHDYVRETHAQRSAERVRGFFQKAGGAVGDVLASICKGHCIDFQILEQDDEFPAQRGVLNQNVNVRALAVYVRLIDLFDITDSRTPYAVWRFVDPRDRKSQTEWAKHRALHAVTFPKYQRGRRVRVDGETADPDVYAALEDLRRYCDVQLRGCSDILADLADSVYHLDLVDLQWEIKPKGFSPVNIRFEFNRTAMFQILSTEIYRGDEYVFLRELVQNCIDAVRVRKVMRSRNNLPNIRDDAIYFNVNEQDNAIIVRCKDNGIGMDERIVRKYLSVAGQSYYHSPDFERLSVDVDPISRFGIGILSCFMVADRIELTTYRDPELFPGSQALRVEIPSMDKQFRIFKGTHQRVGTEVVVTVNRTRLAHASYGRSKNLNVTAYLRAVAAFSEFPIVVTENSEIQVIAKPTLDLSTLQSRFADDARLVQLSQEFDWNEVFELPIGSDAKQFFTLYTVDVRKDLGLHDYEGSIQLVLPNNVADFERRAGSLYLLDSTINFRRPIRVFGPFGSYNPRFVDGISRSAAHHPAVAVYCDGILISEADATALEACVCPGLPVPQAHINIPRRRAKVIDISRAVIRSNPSDWAKDLATSLSNYIARTELPKLKHLSAKARLYSLGAAMRLYNLRSENVARELNQRLWPLPYLTLGGRIVVRDWDLKDKPEVALVPSTLMGIVGEQLDRSEFERASIFTLDGWQDQGSLILPSVTGRNESLSASLRFLRSMVWERFGIATIRFLHPADPSDVPLAQPILRVRDSFVFDSDSIEEKIMNGEDVPFALFRKFVEVRGAASRLLSQMVPFAAPFQHIASYDGEWWNFNHPLCRKFAQFVVTFDHFRRHGRLEMEVEIAITDAIVRIDVGARERVRGNINAGLAKAWTAGKKAAMESILLEVPRLDAKDWIRSAKSNTQKYFRLMWGEGKMSSRFGQVMLEVD